jgi:uncharacterized membrane protein
MQTLYLLLKFVHVLAVIAWVGGVLALALLNARAARLDDGEAQAVMRRLNEYLGRVAIGPAMLLTIIAGIATALSVGLPFTALWIAWGIAGFILSGALTAALGRTSTQFGELAPGDAAAGARMETLRRRLLALNALNLLLLASIVWAMVFKPTF